MKISDLKAKVEEKRKDLTANAGKVIMSSENGPIGFDLFDALIAVIERQDKRISELEKGPRLA